MAHHPADDPARSEPHRTPHLIGLRLAAAGVTAAAIAAGVAGPVAAAPRPVDCVADAPGRTCRPLGAGSLRGASSLAVSPEGSRVYAVAYGSGQLLSFARSASGRLRPDGCIATDGRSECSPAPPYALDGTAGVATDAAGGDVYVASGLARSLTRITADPFAFATCAADFGRHGCTDPERDTLAGASAVAVAGRDVYVTSFDGAAVSHFRGAGDGGLTFAGCSADNGAFGCTPMPGNMLEGAAAVAVAPGGRDVYVGSFRSGSIVRFRRAGNGSLGYRGCLADQGANRCARIRTDALIGLSGLAIGPGGGRLYTAAQTGTMASFTRSRRTGALRFAGCVGRDGRGGCRSPRVNSLRGASALVTRGRSVFVAASRSDAITELRVDRAGRPRFASCVARRARGCARGPGRLLDGLYALARRGRDLYAASPTRASVSRFRIRSSRGSRPRSGGPGS